MNNYADIVNMEERVNKALKDITKELKELRQMQEATTEIKALSEPPQGKWEYCEHEIANHVDGYKCSHCGFFIPWDYMHNSIYFIEDYNFCPSCGARMKGADNE